MSRQRTQRVAWWALVAMIGASVASTVVLKRNYVGEDLLLLVWIAYAPVGAVIARRRPDNPIGWLFLIVGLAASLMELARVGEWAALGNGPPLEWWGYVSAWVLTGVAFPLIILSTAFTFLLYPSGLASRRWRPVLYVGFALIFLSPLFSTLSTFLNIGEPGDPAAFEVRNPLGVMQNLPSLLDSSFLWWGGLLLTFMLLSIFSSLQRAWRARGVERLQMRLFAFAIVVLVLSLWPAQWLATHGYSTLRFVLLAGAFMCVPLACAIAILRHSLYDIDRVIGRTTTYGLVTGVLLAVYALVVTAMTQLLPQSNDLAVALATLVAAALFRPVLRWARGVVDRRFNREQFDAERSVERFAGRLREEVDSDEIRDDLLAVLDRTVQPGVAGLWLSEAHQ
jgi:hypothetical protein